MIESKSFQILYSVYDKRTESFSPPFIALNDDVVRRSVVESLKNTVVARFPDDFQLYAIGDFFEKREGLSPVIDVYKPRLVFDLSEVFGNGNC